MDILKPVKQEIVSTEQIGIKIEYHEIEDEPWQYPQKINPVKQEIVSTEQMNIEKEDHPIESEPWHTHCIKYEMELSKTRNKPFVCEQCCKSFITEGDMSKHIRIHTGNRSENIFL